MKFTYTILPERRLNILRFKGSVSVQDITTVLQQFWADRRYNPEFNGIVSLEGVTTRAKMEDLKVLLDFLENRRQSVGWWAAILTEPKATALALIFKAAFHGSFNLEIVSDWEGACRFLQVDMPAEAVLKV
ncbi:MAG: hypothetical protein WDM96_19790, partial [Lacunisphaera sp.]